MFVPVLRGLIMSEECRPVTNTLSLSPNALRFNPVAKSVDDTNPLPKIIFESQFLNLPRGCPLPMSRIKI